MENNDNNDKMEILSQAIEEDQSQRLAELFEEPHFETFKIFYNSMPFNRWNDEVYDVIYMLMKLHPRITADCKMPSTINEFPILGFSGWEWRTKDWCRIAFALGIPPDWFMDGDPGVRLAFNGFEWPNIRQQYSPLSAILFWVSASKKADHLLNSSSRNPASFKQQYCQYIKRRMNTLEHMISVNHSHEEAKWFACLHLAVGQMVATFMKYVWFVDGGHSVSLVNSVPSLVGHLNNLRCFTGTVGGSGIPATTREVLSQYIKEDFKVVSPRFWCKTGMATFLYANGMGTGHRYFIEMVQQAQKEWCKEFEPVDHSPEESRAIREQLFWRDLFKKPMTFIHEMARKKAHQIFWYVATESNCEPFYFPKYQYLWDSLPNKPKQWSDLSTADLCSAVERHSKYIQSEDNDADIGHYYITQMLRPFFKCVYQRIILLPLNVDTLYFNLDSVDKIGVGSHETFPYNLASFRIRDDIEHWTFLSIPELREIKSSLGFSDFVLQVRNNRVLQDLKQSFEKETNGDSNKPY